MIEVIRNLHVGSDDDVPAAKSQGFARLACAKDGPDGHRKMLGYTTLGAPKGNKYLVAREGNWMALNMIDVDDPTMIKDEMINEGLKFIKEQMDLNVPVLVHCNAGQSRGPTMAFMYLRACGEMPDTYLVSEKKFRSLYPEYDPAVGMRSHCRERWRDLCDLFKKECDGG